MLWSVLLFLLKLQRVHHACMSFVCRNAFGDHVISYLRQLEQLQVEPRVCFLMSVFAHNVIYSGKPSYLYSPIQATQC